MSNAIDNALKLGFIIGAGIIIVAVYAGDFGDIARIPSKPIVKAEKQISTPKSDKLPVENSVPVPAIPAEKIVVPERILPPPPPPPPQNTPPPPPPVKKEEKEREQNICEQHNMKKVVTRNGRSWRCKRRHHD